MALPPFFENDAAGGHGKATQYAADIFHHARRPAQIVECVATHAGAFEQVGVHAPGTPMPVVIGLGDGDQAAQIGVMPDQMFNFIAEQEFIRAGNAIYQRGFGVGHCVGDIAKNADERRDADTSAHQYHALTHFRLVDENSLAAGNAHAIANFGMFMQPVRDWVACAGFDGQFQAVGDYRRRSHRIAANLDCTVNFYIQVDPLAGEKAERGSVYTEPERFDAWSFLLDVRDNCVKQGCPRLVIMVMVAQIVRNTVTSSPRNQEKPN